MYILSPGKLWTIQKKHTLQSIEIVRTSLTFGWGRGILSILHNFSEFKTPCPSKPTDQYQENEEFKFYINKKISSTKSSILSFFMLKIYLNKCVNPKLMYLGSTLIMQTL